MYLGTGDNDAGGDGTPNTIGVLRSADGGATWNTTGLTYSLSYSSSNYLTINQLIFNPADTGTLFAATSFGLLYSKDDGANWNIAINDNMKDVEFEPFHTSTVYAGSYTGTFYRSVDSGKTFVRVISGLPSKGLGRLAIGTTPADSNTVYILAVDSASSAFYGLYRSTDRGQTFTTQSQHSLGAPNLLGWSNTGSDSTGQAWYNLVIQVSPSNRDSVFVAGSWLWESADGGSTFTFNNNFYNNVHIDIHSITFYPGSSSRFLLSSDGGIFKTTDAGNTWTDLSNNLAIAEQYSIGLSSDNPDLWITGWQDNGSSLSGPSWQAVYGGDGMTDFIDYYNDNTLYASYQQGNFAESPDAGVTWYAANGGITEAGVWNTPWMQDPQLYSAVFSGFKNVWKSYDQGSSWASISSWGTYYINALAVAPSNNQYIYAAEYFALYGTSNGGTSWNNITGTLPVSYVSLSAIAVDPVNPAHIWVACSGWNSSYKVFKSVNGGATWSNISAGLPNLPVSCIVYQPGSPDGVYIGTDIGVYYRDSTLGGWIPFNTGLP
ncbi:MAG TPA: glycosyl hydrolase, partial [Bacteroidia bacterium]|nr:glycosyl hydrolase [Bacteroidia bacterium]